jgi:hypothetical protein
MFFLLQPVGNNVLQQLDLMRPRIDVMLDSFFLTNLAPPVLGRLDVVWKKHIVAARVR